MNANSIYGTPVPLSQFVKLSGNGYVSAGIGMRETSSGTIDINLPTGSTIKNAYLYWSVMSNSYTSSLATGNINGNAITGNLIATTATPCWNYNQIYNFRADVTNFITTGSNTLSSFPIANVLLEGASLVAIYDNPTMSQKTILIYDGGITFANHKVSTTMTGFEATDSIASTTFIVADGQHNFAGLNNKVYLGDTLLAQYTLNGAGPGSQYWDTLSLNVNIPTGSTSTTVSVESSNGDCLTWVAQVLSVPSSSNQAPIADAGHDKTVFSGDRVDFIGSATGTIMEYHWDFGDGDNSNQKNPAHRFKGSPYGEKIYTVTLTVKDNNGNTGEDTAYVTVKPLEKNLEISKDYRYAKIKSIYNWVSAKKGYDEYVVNRIDYEYGVGIFTGYIGFSIVNQDYCTPICVPPHPAWHKDIFIINTDIQDLDTVVIGNFYLPLSYDTPEGTFYGITVENEDYSSISMFGWDPAEKFAPSWLDICEAAPPDPKIGAICKVAQFFVLVEPNVNEVKSIDFNPNPGSNPEYITPSKTSFDVAHIASPGDLRVIDSQNNITGMVDGKIKEDIPFSYYNDINKTVIIMNPTGDYIYEVKGTDNGSYGLYVAHVNVTDFNATIYFNAINIPITLGQVHRYTIDWDVLSEGEKGVNLQIDYEGDDIFDRTVQAGSVLDITSPQITINVPTNGGEYILNQNILADWSAIDLESGIASKTGTKQNGEAIDTATVGTKTFTVDAIDNAGNSATKTVSYNVVYNFAGFFQPIDNLPLWNSVKAGSAVPVKFSLDGDQGLDIFTTGYPISQKIDCDLNALLDPIEETVTAGSSSLSYNATIDQYNYVWKTDKAWTGTCRQLVVQFKDGTYHRANFKLLK